MRFFIELRSIGILVVGLIAPATAADRCSSDKDFITVRGVAEEKSLELANGSTRSVWLLSSEKPICIVESEDGISAPRERNISRLQIVGHAPPPGVAIELKGKLSTGNITQYYAEPAAIVVTSGRRIDVATNQQTQAAQVHSATKLAQPFVVTIDVSVSGGTRPIITGKTNLPDGTHLLMALNKPILPNFRERLKAGLPACEGDDCGPLIASHEDKMADDVVVRNGDFSDGPFSNKGAALSPGTYVLDVYNAIPLGQSPDVLEILGQHGENLSGPLVNGCCVGLHFGQPPEQIEEARKKQHRSQTKMATFILYQRYVKIGPSVAGTPNPQETNLEQTPTAQEINEAKRKLTAGIRNRQENLPSYTQTTEARSLPFGGLHWRDGYIDNGKFFRADWQTLEADNGAMYAVDLKSIVRIANGIGAISGVTVGVYVVEGELFDPNGLRSFTFDCAGHFQIFYGTGFTPMTYAPPRSIAAQISSLACAHVKAAAK